MPSDEFYLCLSEFINVHHGNVLRHFRIVLNDGTTIYLMPGDVVGIHTSTMLRASMKTQLAYIPLASVLYIIADKT